MFFLAKEHILAFSGILPLGPVNPIIKNLAVYYPKVNKILDDLHIKRSNYHGKQFEGKQCRLILRNINKLNTPSEMIEFKEVLKTLKYLHILCNEENLPYNYEKKIDDFARACFKLKVKFHISTTPKIHILIDHLSDYFDLTNMSLRKITEEVVEQMHQYVHKRLNKGYWVKDINNPNHGILLLRAVNHINCYNLSIKRNVL